MVKYVCPSSEQRDRWSTERNMVLKEIYEGDIEVEVEAEVENRVEVEVDAETKIAMQRRRPRV